MSRSSDAQATVDALLSLAPPTIEELADAAVDLLDALGEDLQGDDFYDYHEAIGRRCQAIADGRRR